MSFQLTFPERPFPSRFLMFAVSLLYRLIVGIRFLQIGGISRQWTNEMASVAGSLVLHHSFAGAYSGYSGPTAWVAPAYPFMVAAVFEVFGVDTQGSALTLLLLNIVASALTAVVIYRLGHECFSERIGLVAGWMWALSPLGALIPLLLWETSFSALMFSLGLLVLLRTNSLRQWAATGALWGVAALFNPTLLAPLPAIFTSMLWKAPRKVRTVTLFSLTLICVLLPWSIRNRQRLGEVFPVRIDGWAEIYFGNINFGMHPAANVAGPYQRMGEVAFVNKLKQETIQHITDQPGRFALMSSKRWIRFWIVPVKFLPLTLAATCGCWLGTLLLLHKSHRFAVPFASVLIFYPMIFSMTHIEARYRHPIEPVIYLLAAYAGCEFYDGYKKWMEGRKFRSNVSALTYRLTQ